MQKTSVEIQKKRIENLAASRRDVKDCLYEYRIFNYEPGNVSYFLGEYPLSFPMSPTEYDYETLKKYSEYGIKLIKIHEEWNDAIRVLGADKYSAHDDKGFREFVDMCHQFDLKVLPYVSSGYMHTEDPDFRAEFARSDRILTGQYFRYATCSLKSPEWRSFIYNKMMNVMDEYGVDGIFNDHPPDDQIYIYEKHLAETGEEFDPDLMPYNPEAEDFLAQLYHGIKRRNGISILHFMGNYRPMTKERIYDYFNVGEGVSSGKGLLKSKNYMPHIINILDKKSQTTFGPDFPFALAIPYLQFPRLNHGRRLMRDKTTANVKWYNVTEKSLYHFWKRAGEFAKAHPNGPYTHGEFSAIPDPEDLVDRYGGFVKLYKPMITDDTVAHVELHETTLLCNSTVPDDIIATLFTNEKQYLVFTNIGKTPWAAELCDEWTDRVSGVRSKIFTVPPEQIIFLVKE